MPTGALFAWTRNSYKIEQLNANREKKIHSTPTGNEKQSLCTHIERALECYSHLSFAKEATNYAITRKAFKHERMLCYVLKNHFNAICKNKPSKS